MSAETETSPTRILCNNITKLSTSDIPQLQLTRAKYLILDGIACALVGAHLPHSEKAANVIFSMEPSGTCSVIGYPDRKLSPCSAALINSTFIQGFEIDDWHTEAPLHSNSLLIPSLLAAAEHKKTSLNPGAKTSGADILLAMIAGYETGPRVGNALWGRHILSVGWHSGAVFGPAASAAAIGKLYGFNVDTMEDAFGLACTQAGGLMSAQFESEGKRMQHGFAARAGVLAACLAEGGYVGIKRVFEREYGGFLFQFSGGNGKTPQYKSEELYKGWGQKWQLEGVCCKPYATMAATHTAVDCLKLLQDEYPEQLQRANLKNIKAIDVTLDEASFHHGGFQIKRPLLATGAQMSIAYVAATQLVDREVMVREFSPASLERDEVWSVADKTKCALGEGFGEGTTDIKITFNDGTSIEKKINTQRGVNPPLSNEELVEKYRTLMKPVIDEERMQKIEKMVLNIDQLEDIDDLIKLLTPVTADSLHLSA